MSGLSTLSAPRARCPYLIHFRSRSFITTALFYLFLIFVLSVAVQNSGRHARQSAILRRASVVLNDSTFVCSTDTPPSFITDKFSVSVSYKRPRYRHEANTILCLRNLACVHPLFLFLKPLNLHNMWGDLGGDRHSLFSCISHVMLYWS